LSIEWGESALAAVGADDGREWLRATVKGFLDEGMSSRALLDDLERLRDLVPTETDEDKVLDVMDLLVGWCAPGARLAPPANTH